MTQQTTAHHALRINTIWLLGWVFLAGLGACSDDDGQPPIDAAVDGALDGAHPDGTTDGAPDIDAFVPPRPTMTIAVSRATADATQLPDVRVEVTVHDAEGAAWQGDVTVTAENPQGMFSPQTSAVTALGEGRYQTEVQSPQSGEVRIEAGAQVEGDLVTAEITVVFLPYLSPNWSIPRALDELNTAGLEDSIAVSPDGNTLFFSYTPLVGCTVPASEWTTECTTPAGPYTEPERPCVYGVDNQGEVTVGLYGNTNDPPDGWSFTKALFNSYAAHRDADGRFTRLDCLGFDDDGVISEVSPSSGPENPVLEEPYTLFFAFPDWLNFDGDQYYGTLLATAQVTAGQPAVLGGPILNGGQMPPNLNATLLTGPINDDLMERVIGEYRVYLDPIDGNHYLHLAAEDTQDASDWNLVRSPLQGTYPVGEWGALQDLPAPLNTAENSERFGWPVTLRHGADSRKEMFFNRGPHTMFSAPGRIMHSWWNESESTWAEPVTVAQTDNSFGLATVFVLALPAVADTGSQVEMFFVYSVITQLSPDLRWNHQLAVSHRLNP